MPDYGSAIIPPSYRLVGRMTPPMPVNPHEVPIERLQWACGTQGLQFHCTNEVTPLEGFVGQDRAISAIEFGLGLRKAGYNLFVTGMSGTGKASAIKEYVQRIVADRLGSGDDFDLHDWCYLHNFSDTDRPAVLQLSPGQGRVLRQQIADLLAVVRDEVPKIFAGDTYTDQRKQLEERGRARHQEAIRQLESHVSAAGFAVEFGSNGVNLFPMRNGQPLPLPEYRALSEDQRAVIDSTRERLMTEVQRAMEAIQQAESEARSDTVKLDTRVSSEMLEGLFRALRVDYASTPPVRGYLDSLFVHTLSNMASFRQGYRSADGEVVSTEQSPAGGTQGAFLPYEINLLVDNGSVAGAPIVVEPNPTWGNLFGRIERQGMMGASISDHTMLKAGAIHQANGGYIVLDAKALLSNSMVWGALKRVIQNREVRLEDPGEQSPLYSPVTLRPEAIPVDLKVIVAGDEITYRQLFAFDQEDFGEMFKVKAEFDSQIALTQENVGAYACFISGICRSESLLHFEPSGVVKVVEYGSRLVADQNKLSSRFSQIRDLVVESDYWARQENSELVTDRHVRRALEEKIYRVNLTQRRIQQNIDEGSLMVDLTGEVVGQVNSLVVLDMGDLSFGYPSRITVRTFAGRRGVINIERESHLSGSIHDKGVLILTGYLGWKHAQDHPLSLSASISFEQSYSGIDGDSASSTELYAILSSLADLPIKQGIAVTGSVNQKGDIQPIGGAIQKVEGFFEVCRAKGLTGDQGVLLPYQNLRNLVLREDVVEAVQEGMFHIYAIETVEQGIEILTGVPAGERLPDGAYPEGTVHHLVAVRLEQMARSMRGFYADALDVV